MENISNPWPGNCGSGIGKDTYTSGFEGPWTTTPTKWSNEFFIVLQNSSWEKYRGPADHYQWRVANASGPLADVMRLTTDVALLHDTSYAKIVEEFAANRAALDAAFGAAWFKLTNSGGLWSKERKCVALVPIPTPPRPSGGLIIIVLVPVLLVMLVALVAGCFCWKPAIKRFGSVADSAQPEV